MASTTISEIEKIELQNYFWKEIQNQLILLGYKIETEDLTYPVKLYYTKGKRGNQWYGFTFPVCKIPDGEIVQFRVELGVEDQYFYGFYRPEMKYENDEIVKVVKQLSDNFKSNHVWYGYKLSDKYQLDFEKFDSPEFKNLKNPEKKRNTD